MDNNNYVMVIHSTLNEKQKKDKVMNYPFECMESLDRRRGSFFIWIVSVISIYCPLVNHETSFITDDRRNFVLPWKATMPHSIRHHQKNENINFLDSSMFNRVIHEQFFSQRNMKINLLYFQGSLSF